ncbi:MAG: hypothetical protein JZU62_09220, partial [Sulfuricurvum sp.]|uniref:hypothetical protein n=1 Tax=Sulfuricurvum sp. TaxID=2025608 RepID=UPI0025D17AD5
MHEAQASLYINHNTNGYSIGLAMFEPYGLKGWFSEIESDSSHPFSAIDRVLHLLFVTNAQYLIIGAASKALFDEVIDNFVMFDYRYDNRHFESE